MCVVCKQQIILLPKVLVLNAAATWFICDCSSSYPILQAYLKKKIASNRSLKHDFTVLLTFHLKLVKVVFSGMQCSPGRTSVIWLKWVTLMTADWDWCACNKAQFTSQLCQKMSSTAKRSKIVRTHIGKFSCVTFLVLRTPHCALTRVSSWQ